MQILLGISFFTLPIYGQFDKTTTGGATFSILEIDLGPRMAAMSGAFCAISDDITAIWCNPAGLGQLSWNEVNLCHQEWASGFRDEYGGIGVKTAGGIVATSFLYSGASGIEGYTEVNQPLEEFRTYESMLNIAYGMRIKEKLYFGLSMKGLYQNLDPGITGLHGDKGEAIASDIGFLWRGNKAGFGISLQNIGSDVNYSFGATEKLPINIKTGFSLTLLHALNIAIDANVPQFGKPHYHLGGELWLGDVFAIRGGYRYRDETQLSTNNISAGFGIRAKNIGIDYAYASCGDLGITHRIALNWIWGFMPKPFIKTGDVVVKVFNAETQEPLQAIVIIKGVMSDTVLTSKDNGEVRFKDIPTGRLKVTAQKDFYTLSEETLTVVAEKTKRIELAINYIGPKEKLPPGITGIFGRVTGSEANEPLLATIHYTGQVTATTTTDADGWYAVTDIPPGTYTVFIEADVHKYFTQTIPDVIVEQGKGTLLHCILKNVKTLRLYFESAKSYIHPAAYEELDTLAAFIKQYTENIFEIHGHTDSRPIYTKEFKNNLELSYARANAVRDYIMRKHGVSGDRLTVKGFGATKPIANNKTQQGMALNRRIEIIMKLPQE
ncbi:MAG: PorV/PorQ family protein [bacterium]|nr:PorV/PorQ family protein [bacterium]